MCAYYDEYIDGCLDNDYFCDDEEDFPEELTKPLAERTSGVYEAITWLVENGYDFDEGESDCPLMMSVGYADAPMTQFLIQHGANLTKCPFIDERVEITQSNYYLDDIEYAYYDRRWQRTERYIQALLQTKKVLNIDCW